MAEIEIKLVEGERRPYLDLLLLADPDLEIVEAYLDKGALFGLLEDGVICGEILLIPHDNQTIEIKNLAVAEDRQGCGYGKRLVTRAKEYAHQQGYNRLIVGTGNAEVDILAFYQKQGFRFYAVIRDFFTDNYREPIFENGIQCRDMLMLDQSVG